MNETDFHRLADALLDTLSETLEEADRDGLLEAESAPGALTVALPSGKQWLISKHTPNRQIWLASPVSGGVHFSYDDGRWLADGKTLQSLLSQELKALGNIDAIF